MKALDLCCGAGGVSAGLVAAGFDVTGVDIAPQPRYPYPFLQADALAVLADTAFIRQFALIWASWPCQRWSLGAQRWAKEWPDLITPGRALLAATGLPYIMENVVGAPLENAVLLCGTMFGLGVIRHRLFESNLLLLGQPHNTRLCRGGIARGEFCTVAGHGGNGSGRYSVWAVAMGIDWMTKAELRQAIPPAYSAYLGRQVIRQLAEVAA